MIDAAKAGDSVKQAEAGKRWDANADDIAVFLSGVAFTPLIISFMTILQLAAEDAYMGRVNSLVNTGMAVAMLVSLSSGGALADLFGVRQVIGGGAAILALAGLLSLAMIRATPVRQPAIEEPVAEALSA